MKLKRYLKEEVIAKIWNHDWMTLSAEHGGKGIYITYKGFLKPGGREITKEFIVKDWKQAEKKIKAYMKKLPYSENEYTYSEEQGKIR